MKILDVCCGSRMFWYDKQEPHTTYMDIRKAVYTAMDRSHSIGGNLTGSSDGTQLDTARKQGNKHGERY